MSRLNPTGNRSILNCCFRTPKMCSMTLQAEEWRRLKSSSFVSGLKTVYVIKKKKKNVPHPCTAPFSKVDSNSTVGGEQFITGGVSSIGKIILATRDNKVFGMGSFKYTCVRCGAFPARIRICELHVEGAGK